MKRIIIIALAMMAIAQSMMARERRMTLKRNTETGDGTQSEVMQSSRMAVERTRAMQGTIFNSDPTSISFVTDPDEWRKSR